MCFAVAALQGTLGVASAILGQQAAEQSVYQQQLAAKQQAENAINSMNHTFASYEAERTDAFDAAVRELEKTHLNAMSNNATVAAAIGEDIGTGRTASLLMRNVEGDEARAASSIKENYKRKSDEIDLNKEAALTNTQTTLKGIKAPSMPSKASMLVGIGSAILGGYNTAQNMNVEAKKYNLKTDFWKGIH